MQDQWGVPETMFGRVPEEFYGLIGRVVLVATLVEDRLLGLLWALDDQPQPTHAGKPFSQLVVLIRDRLGWVDASLRSEIEAIVAEVEASMEGRNALVHSLWPNPTPDRAFGWRSRRRPKADGGGSEMEYTNTSQKAMAHDLSIMLRLPDRLLRVTNYVHAARARQNGSA